MFSKTEAQWKLSFSLSLHYTYVTLNERNVKEMFNYKIVCNKDFLPRCFSHLKPRHFWSKRRQAPRAVMYPGIVPHFTNITGR